MKTRSFPKFLRRLHEAGLRDEVEKLSLAAHVSLRDLYEGSFTQSIVSVRRSVYLWLAKEGKSAQEISALFDRAPAGVLRLMNGGKRKSMRGRWKR